MATTCVIRPVGPTYAMSVTASQHAAIAVKPSGNDISNYAAFVNSGSVDICVTIAPYNTTPATAVLVFPVDGTPTLPNSFVLHANAVAQPINVAVPEGGFCVSAIGASAGPSIMYITPIGDQ